MVKKGSKKRPLRPEEVVKVPKGKGTVIPKKKAIRKQKGKFSPDWWWKKGSEL